MVAFFIAHLANLMVAHALTRVVPGPVARLTTESRVPTLDRVRLVEEILASGLFPRDAPSSGMAGFGPSGQSGLPGSVSQMGPPIEAAKKVKLIGTVAGGGRSDVAVLEDIGSKKQTLYHLHELVAAVGEIVEIRSDAIRLRQGLQEELLPLSNGLPAKLTPSQTVNGLAAGMAGGAEASFHRVLDRREVTQSMADLPLLLSQARAVAFYVNGKQEGWRMESLAPQSFYEKIGLKTGDVLQRLNGADLRDPGMMLAFFQQVKEERTVTLDVLRQDRKTTLTYEIR